LNNKNIIKISHDLNHFRGAYTKLELDFIYAFISSIKDEDEELVTYSINLNELEKKLNKRLQLKDMEYIFDSLISKSFKINNEKKLIAYSFFTMLAYDKETKNISVEFNHSLKPHLLKLKIFAKGNLKYVLSFKSEYSKRLYMLLSQWRRTAKKIYTVIELREVLAIPKSYRYFDIKKNVLLKAEAEMKKDSDVFFEFEEIKNGRQVTAISFSIYQSGGEDKTRNDNFEHFKNKHIYYNSQDWTIINVWKTDTKDYVLVQLIDDSNHTLTDKIHLNQLEKMVEYMENRQKTLL